MSCRNSKVHVVGSAQFLKDECIFTLVYIPLDTEQHNNHT